MKFHIQSLTYEEANNANDGIQMWLTTFKKHVSLILTSYYVHKFSKKTEGIMYTILWIKAKE